MFSLHTRLGCLLQLLLATLEISRTSETSRLQQRDGKTVSPPRIFPFQFREDLTVGSRTRITCEAAEGDLPLSFHW